MAGNYEIKKVYLSEEFALLRVPEIEVEGSTIENLSRAVNKNIPQSFLENVYLKSVGKAFYEVFMRADLQTIRNIDSDSDLRQAFIDSRLPPNVAAKNIINGDLIPLIILVLEIKVGDTLLDSDVNYVNDILTWISNKIYVTPILRFADEINRENRIKFYMNFLSRLLASKKTLSEKIRAAASIHSLFGPSKIPQLLETYKDENKSPSFVVIDFDRNRITSSRMIGATNGVRRFFKKEEGPEPKYAVYGFNVKPFKKGEESPLAEDMGCYISGISAIGDIYRLNNSAPMFVPPVQKLADLPRVFNSEEYKYTRLDNDGTVNDFSDWYQRYTSKPVEAPFPKYRSYTHRYNVQKVSEEISKISSMIKKGETDVLKERVSSKDITKALRGKTF